MGIFLFPLQITENAFWDFPVLTLLPSPAAEVDHVDGLLRSQRGTEIQPPNRFIDHTQVSVSSMTSLLSVNAFASKKTVYAFIPSLCLRFSFH